MAKDTRYGWAVVGATFLVAFITDGLGFSFGILLIELLRVFDKGRASTAIIGSLITGFMHLVGPVAGLLSETYGYRVVVIAGSLISAVGFFISAFVDNLPYLYVTYGLCGGVGFGLMLLPASVCVIQHFEKRRSLANGIAVCGSGVGSFAMNLITGYLLEMYGWRGTIMIQSGILLNGIACGLVFISPDETTEYSGKHGKHIDKPTDNSDKLAETPKTLAESRPRNKTESPFISDANLYELNETNNDAAKQEGQVNIHNDENIINSNMQILGDDTKENVKVTKSQNKIDELSSESSKTRTQEVEMAKRPADDLQHHVIISDIPGNRDGVLFEVEIDKAIDRLNDCYADNNDGTINELNDSIDHQSDESSCAADSYENNEYAVLYCANTSDGKNRCGDLDKFSNESEFSNDLAIRTESFNENYNNEKLNYDTHQMDPKIRQELNKQFKIDTKDDFLSFEEFQYQHKKELEDIDISSESSCSTNGTDVGAASLCKKLCDLQLIRDRKLLAFLLSGFFMNLAFTVPFNFTPDQAVENGMTKHEAYWLASSIGITNTISRVIIGWLADRKFTNRLVMLMSTLVLVGIATILSVLMSTFATKMIYTCVFGFLVGGYITLCPVVLADLFGVNVIARSFGLFWFSVGISGLISNPIAGFLFDETGNYVISFVTAGSEFIIAGAILLHPFFSVRRQKAKETKQCLS